MSTSSGHFVPKSGVGRGTGAFIYALSADKTSPAFAAPRHAITALLSCCFKCPCPSGWQPHFRSNADRAYNTLHFASKVVCQRDTLWKPRTTKQAEYPALFRCLILSLFCCQQPPFRGLFSPFVKFGVDNFGGNGSGKLWKLWTDTCPNMWFVHIVKHRAKSERFSAFLSEKDT